MSTNKPKIQANIKQDLYEKLEERRKKERRSMSAMIEIIIEDWLTERGEIPPPKENN